MDTIQEQHERAVGDAFVEWYNQRNGTEYRYDTRGTDPPDLIYRSGSQQLILEITAAYYDAGNAAMLWRNARGVPHAPNSWSSKSPDLKLIESINSTIKKKCAKQYPPSCVLLVALYPDLTSAEEFAELMPQVEVPTAQPFTEIYVGGLFPASSSGSLGGHCYWKLA